MSISALSRPRVTIVGAGNVGSACAHWLARKDLCDIVLLDRPETGTMAQGKALDLLQCGPIEGFSCQIQGTVDYRDTAGSAVVVVTAGVPRKPGMSRDDLLKINAGIVEGIARESVRSSPEAILIIVSNPLDVMTYVAWAASGLPPERVVGQAGILDVARFRTFLATELSVPVTDVEATLLGGHGDAMVPLPRLATVRGKPVTDLIAPARLTEIVERTRDGGAEIVRLLQTGSAYEAPGAATAAMVEAILRDSKTQLPCCAYCQGEYGVEGLFVGVPVILGRKGVEEIVELDLTEGEREEFRKSVASVEELVTLWKRQTGRVEDPS